jgi:DNA primase
MKSEREMDKKMIYTNELKERSLSVIEFYLHFGNVEFDTNTIVGKKKWAEKCLEIVTKIQSSIEVDIYMEQISRTLGIDRNILYNEYYKIKRNARMSQIKTKGATDDTGATQEKFSPSLPDLIAGYIHRYGFLDLFFREFQYTEADLKDIPES